MRLVVARELLVRAGLLVGDIRRGVLGLVVVEALGGDRIIQREGAVRVCLARFTANFRTR